MKDYLKQLEREINHNKKEKEREEQIHRLKEISLGYAGPDEVISSKEVERRIRREGIEPYIPTGIGGLDAIIKGFRAKQLIVISAPPKSGKTSFCMHLTRCMSDYNPLWIPLEQDVEELVSTAIERGQDVPLYFAPEQNQYPSMTDWIEQKIIEGMAKFNSRIVIIDHLSFVNASDVKEKERYVQVGRAIEKIREIGKKLCIPIVLVCHIKKSDPTEIPTTEDLYESAMIHQLCDMVLMLWRECYKENKMMHFTDKVLLSVQANRRNGTTGNVRMRYTDFTFVEDPTMEFRHEMIEESKKRANDEFSKI